METRSARSLLYARKEIPKRPLKANGLSTTATYRSWRGMMTRCFNPKHHSYQQYGAKAVTVCERWQKFENFQDDMGQRPAGTSIDRYPNPAGNYEPGNTRWATPKEQMMNRRPWTKKLTTS